MQMIMTGSSSIIRPSFQDSRHHLLIEQVGHQSKYSFKDKYDKAREIKDVYGIV